MKRNWKKGLVVVVLLLVGLVLFCQFYDRGKAESNAVLLSDPAVAAYYEEIGLADELRKKTRYVKEPITAPSGKVWYLMLPSYWQELYVLEQEPIHNGMTFRLYDKYNAQPVDDPLHRGLLWEIAIYTREDFFAFAPISDLSEVYGEEFAGSNLIIGEDEQYIYRYYYPIDMQCYENDLAIQIYDAVRENSKQLVDKFIEANHIKKNTLAPKLK